jgi:hypothetical protein
MGTNDIAELLKLEVNERLAIAERLNAYLKDPSNPVGWDQVKKELGL